MLTCVMTTKIVQTTQIVGPTQGDDKYESRNPPEIGPFGLEYHSRDTKAVPRPSRVMMKIRA